MAILAFALPMLLMPAAAMAEGSVSVAPAVVMLSGEPGQSTTQTLSFTNGTSQPFAFEMAAQDAIIRNGKRVFVAAGSVRGGIASSAVFSRRTATVEAGQTLRVDVTVTIPPDPAVRAIAVVCRGTTKFGSGPTKMTGGVGTLLTFTIKGDAVVADASPLLVRPPSASTNLVASQQLVNSGTAPFVAAGMLAILDAKGKLAGRQALNPWRLLPGEKSEMRVEYGGELAPGRYRAMITYDLTGKTLTTSADFDVR